MVACPRCCTHLSSMEVLARTVCDAQPGTAHSPEKTCERRAGKGMLSAQHNSAKDAATEPRMEQRRLHSWPCPGCGNFRGLSRMPSLGPTTAPRRMLAGSLAPGDTQSAARAESRKQGKRGIRAWQGLQSRRLARNRQEQDELAWTVLSSLPSPLLLSPPLSSSLLLSPPLSSPLLPSPPLSSPLLPSLSPRSWRARKVTSSSHHGPN